MEATVNTPTIASAIEGYIQLIKQSRSNNTALTYGKALKEFKKTLVNARIDPENSPVSVLTEDFIKEFTILEFYTAYKDYLWMMETTEQLLEKSSGRCM